VSAKPTPAAINWLIIRFSRHFLGVLPFAQDGR
jgi:hypothetical protein